MPRCKSKGQPVMSDSVYLCGGCLCLAMREMANKNMPCQHLQEMEKRRGGYHSSLFSSPLQKLVGACQGHMAMQPVYQSAECNQTTQFYHAYQYSVVVSSCGVTSVCLFLLCLCMNLCMHLSIHTNLTSLQLH